MAGELPRVERDEDGHPVFVHVCDYGEEALEDLRYSESRATLPLAPQGWAWSADGGLTPSLLCGICKLHGFWIGGDVPYWRAC